jgi:hypothetical protein
MKEERNVLHALKSRNLTGFVTFFNMLPKVKHGEREDSEEELSS